MLPSCGRWAFTAGHGQPRQREQHHLRDGSMKAQGRRNVEPPGPRESCFHGEERPEEASPFRFALWPCSVVLLASARSLLLIYSRKLISPLASPPSFTGFGFLAHVFNRHPLIQVLPSGFYSVFFSLNKTESLCQFGIGLKTEASQCVRLAGGQARMKCPMPLEKPGRHHARGGGGPRTAGAGGSCISSTSAPGTEISTDSTARPGAGLFEGKALGTRHHLPFQVRQVLGLEKQSLPPLGPVTVPLGSHLPRLAAEGLSSGSFGEAT